ncbi:hypothetical protein [Propionispora sp. 2/2-37]|nr:hypothetical protein [Propionispora sp. 2/2-37]
MKEKKKKVRKEPNCIIRFTNQPSEQAIDNLHRYVYERLLIILEEKFGHK